MFNLRPHDLILASLLGLLPMSHSHGEYIGRPTRSPSLSLLRNLDRIPIVGTEAGDRAEIERVPVGTFLLPAGQSTIIASPQIPVGDPWMVMRLNLRGQLVGAAGAAGTVLPDAPCNLWGLGLSTDYDGAVIEPFVSCRPLYRYNHIINGTAPDLVAPTVVAATTTDFSVNIDIPFIDERMMVPMDSVLDTRRYNSVTLTINTGVLTDIVSGAANLTLGTCYVDIELVRVSPRVEFPMGIASILPYYKQHAPIVPAGATTINLDRVPTRAMKRLLMLATTGSTAGTPWTGSGTNAIIDTLMVTSNVRQHFGSANGGVTRRTLQSGNKVDYALEVWPVGLHVADFVLDGSNGSALATGDKAQLDAVFGYQGGLPATPQVSLLFQGVEKLRGKEAK